MKYDHKSPIHSVDISWDDDAGVWIAISDSIPLALENMSFDTLVERVKVVSSEILSLNSGGASRSNLLIKSERLIANG